MILLVARTCPRTGGNPEGPLRGIGLWSQPSAGFSHDFRVPTYRIRRRLWNPPDLIKRSAGGRVLGASPPTTVRSPSTFAVSVRVPRGRAQCSTARPGKRALSRNPAAAPIRGLPMSFADRLRFLSRSRSRSRARRRPRPSPMGPLNTERVRRLRRLADPFRRHRRPARGSTHSTWWGGFSSAQTPGSCVASEPFGERLLRPRLHTHSGRPGAPRSTHTRSYHASGSPRRRRRWAVATSRASIARAISRISFRRPRCHASRRARMPNRSRAATMGLPARDPTHWRVFTRAMSAASSASIPSEPRPGSLGPVSCTRALSRRRVL